MWEIRKNGLVMKEFPTKDQCMWEAYSLGWIDKIPRDYLANDERVKIKNVTICKAGD